MRSPSSSLLQTVRSRERPLGNGELNLSRFCTGKHRDDSWPIKQTARIPRQTNSIGLIQLARNVNLSGRPPSLRPIVAALNRFLGIIDRCCSSAIFSLSPLFPFARILSSFARQQTLSSPKPLIVPFSAAFTDTAVALRRFQVPEFGSGAVPCPGHPVHADLRARSMRSGGNDRRAALGHLIRQTPSPPSLHRRRRHHHRRPEPRGPPSGAVDPDHGQVRVRA